MGDAVLLTYKWIVDLSLFDRRVELHPFLPQHDLVKYCLDKGIQPQAYSPLGSSGGPVLQDELVQSIAKAHGADAAQVAISWAVQRGVVVLPKSVTPGRIETNGKLIVLSDDEMLQLNELHKQEGKSIRLVKPNVSIFLLALCAIEADVSIVLLPVLAHSGVWTSDGEETALVPAATTARFALAMLVTPLCDTIKRLDAFTPVHECLNKVDDQKRPSNRGQKKQSR